MKRRQMITRLRKLRGAKNEDIMLVRMAQMELCERV